MERDFRVGERVAFVDDEIKGRVKSVGDGKVVVVSDDGFEYRCAPNEIVSQEQAKFLMHQITGIKIRFRLSAAIQRKTGSLMTKHIIRLCALQRGFARRMVYLPKM